jgi:hypothetical protein
MIWHGMALMHVYYIHLRDEDRGDEIQYEKIK